MIVFFLVVFLQLVVFSVTSKIAMAQKRILVTGGNKGIGLAICRAIIEKHPDTHVLLGCRDAARGAAAVASLIESLGSESGSRLEALTIDVNDENSIASAAASVSNKYGSSGSLYGVVNNAGIGFGNTLADVLRTNYYGPKLVTNAFLPLLQQPGGRVVHIASAAGPMYVQKRDAKEQKLLSGDTDTTLDMLEAYINSALTADGAVQVGDGDTYGFSKACLNMLTILQAKANPSVIINSCTPGFIATDMTAGMGATNAPEKGTLAPLHLLFGEEAALGTGRYYGSDAVRSPLDRYRGPGDPPFEP